MDRELTYCYYFLGFCDRVCLESCMCVYGRSDRDEDYVCMHSGCAQWVCDSKRKRREKERKDEDEKVFVSRESTVVYMVIVNMIMNVGCEYV